MAGISGGEAVVRLLQAAGVDVLFGINGAHVDGIYQASLDHGLRIVDTRHEMNAGHGAEGYARTRNSLGVALLTAGGGFTNAVTSMANAFLDRTPVLYVVGSGTLAGDQTNTLQAGIDQVAIATPVTKWAHRVTRTELIPRILARAIRTALDGPRGPVLVDIPWDVLRGQVEDLDPGAELLAAPRYRGAPPAAAIEEILALLAAAERPVIVAGSELVRSGAAEDLQELATLADVPILGDYEALAATSGTPLGFGLVQSLYGLDPAPDLVIMLGLRFGLTTAHGSGRLIPHTARVVQVDPDARELGHLQHVDLSVLADPGTTARELRDALAAGPRPTSRAAWRQQLRAHIDQRRASVTELVRADPDEGRIHPYDAVRAIAEAVPAGSTVVADGALTYLWLSETIPDAGLGAYLCHGYFGTMGLGMGVALGAQAAAPDGTVVLVTGDGAVGYSLGEFDSMVRAGLPVVVVILNNRAWGATLHAQQVSRGRDRVTHNRLENGSYFEVAAALGANGYEVTDLADLAPTLAKAIGDRHPACIEVAVALDPFPPEERMMISGKPY